MRTWRGIGSVGVVFFVSVLGLGDTAAARPRSANPVPASISIESPAAGQLASTTALSVSIRVEGDVRDVTLRVELDGEVISLSVDGNDVGPGVLLRGELSSLAEGAHAVHAEVTAEVGVSGVRCVLRKQRAASRDVACRFRAAVRALRSGDVASTSACDTRIEASYAAADARYGTCYAMDDATTQASRDTSLVAGQLIQVGAADGADSREAKRCATDRARAIARHYRCEASAVSREGLGRDATELRARCNARLEASFSRSASRYDDACVGDASTVAFTNVGVAADLEAGDELISDERDFETADFPLAEGCDPLVRSHCMLPFPSMALFEATPGETLTGYRMNLLNPIPLTMNGDPLWSDPYDGFDGVSPTVQILMHFEAELDLAASGAPVLLEARCCGQSQTPPYEGVRTMDETSLGAQSPTVLVDLDTGERVAHFVELDSRTDDPSRQLLFLRPDRSLVPGHHYGVAVRGLMDTAGAPVVPEPAFRALRDGLPTSVASLEARRPQIDSLLGALEGFGVEREDLILAFEFVVRSDEQLTGDMLAMRDTALAWLDANPFAPTFDWAFITDPSNHNPDCATTGEAIGWRLRGTYSSPFFLAGDDVQALPHYLNGQDLARDADGAPRMVGTHALPFDLAIPCDMMYGDTPPRSLLVGHGLFGDGPGMVDALAELGPTMQAFGVEGLDFITAGTSFRGLSNVDLLWVGVNIIGLSDQQFNHYPWFVARLQQGMTDTLSLAHVLKTARFNELRAFQKVWGNPASGRFPQAEEPLAYYGVSLGGIMGLFFAALTPDVEKLAVDVGAINFSLLLQRSTQFKDFENLLTAVGLTDPMDVGIGQGLLHEQWVVAEPAGYARHITGLVDEPLPGTPAKQILMPVAWLDKQVSNQASVIAARTLGIPNLEGSLQQNIPGLPDATSPQLSGYVMWSTGVFDVFDPAYDPVIPALANAIPSGVCDPHNGRLAIPAAFEQLARFHLPGGQVENTCTGPCDASEDWEKPGGGSEPPCDPLN